MSCCQCILHICWNCQSPPTHVLVNTQAHTIFLMECHIYLKYGLWHYHLHHYDWLRNLREGGVRSIFHIFNNQTMLWILHLKYTFSVVYCRRVEMLLKCFYFSVMFSVWSHRTVLVSQIYWCLVLVTDIPLQLWIACQRLIVLAKRKWQLYRCRAIRGGIHNTLILHFISFIYLFFDALEDLGGVCYIL